MRLVKSSNEWSTNVRKRNKFWKENPPKEILFPKDLKRTRAADDIDCGAQFSLLEISRIKFLTRGLETIPDSQEEHESAGGVYKGAIDA